MELESHKLLSNFAFNFNLRHYTSEGFVDIRRMAALREFDASNNAIVGTIPPALAGLPALRLLDLSRNALHGTAETLLRY